MLTKGEIRGCSFSLIYEQKFCYVTANILLIFPFLFLQCALELFFMYFTYTGLVLHLGKHRKTENVFSQMDLGILAVRNLFHTH